MCLFDELPEEIRLHTFRLATLKAGQTEDTRVDYQPFDAVALIQRDWSDSNQRALTVKLNIVLVCKEWRRIATEMLYECIRIQHGTESLLATLQERSPASNTYENGQWVRRIEISPHIADFDPFNPVILTRILKCCPSVESIVRSCVLGSGGVRLSSPRLPQDGRFPNLPSLKRIDWWLPGIGVSAGTSEHISGFLKDLLQESPNLTYLTLSGFRYRIFDTVQKGSIIIPDSLSSLSTLRLECHEDVEVALKSAIDIKLACVSRLVHGGKPSITLAITKILGPQIRLLELIDLECSRLEWRGLIALLHSCPNLEELSLQHNMRLIGNVPPAETLRVTLKALETVRIHLNDTAPLESQRLGKWITCDIVAPSLEEVILHGGKRVDWEQLGCYPLLCQWVVKDDQRRTLEFV